MDEHRFSTVDRVDHGRLGPAGQRHEDGADDQPDPAALLTTLSAYHGGFSLVSVPPPANGDTTYSVALG